jgi:DNA primase
LERDVLKLAVQVPQLMAPLAGELGGNDFTHPTYRAVWGVVASCGGPGSATEAWPDTLRAAANEPPVLQALNALAVEPLHTTKEPDRTYVAAHVYRLQELTALRAISDLKSRLQRTNPVDQATEYNRMFGDLVVLEQHRRDLRERAIGGDG